MVKMLSLILVVAVGASFINTEVITSAIPAKPGFTYLGSIRKPVKNYTATRGDSVTFAEWNYFLSDSAAGHAAANRDCEENGGALVQIESYKKRDEVETFLSSTDQQISKVWVGAKYKKSSHEFVWKSGAPVLPGLWAPGEPNQLAPVSRVVANIAGGEIQLESQPATHVTRYICEL